MGWKLYCNDITEEKLRRKEQKKELAVLDVQEDIQAKEMIPDVHKDIQAIPSVRDRIQAEKVIPDVHEDEIQIPADIQAALKIKLNQELKRITQLYAIYVKCIRENLQAMGKTPIDLGSDLLNVAAFSHSRQDLMLLSSHQPELKKADNLNDIFDLLSREYASFLNYDIFEFIVNSYKLDKSQEELQYPEHLQDYIKRHSISEFMKINPLLKEISDTSTELILKINMSTTSRLAKITELKESLANTLHINIATLRLLDIKDGCIEVTFLLPTHIAELLFNEHTCFTEEMEEFQKKWSIHDLKCNNQKLSFIAKPLKKIEQEFQVQK